MNRGKRAWLWPILLAVTIFTLSGTARLATPDISFQFSKDKIGHFLVFGLLATSILRIPCIRQLGWHGAIITAAITIAYGGFDEFRQSFTPGRQVEFADWIADSLGAVVAVIIYQLDTPYRQALEWSPFAKNKKIGS
ncbi:MAG: VanZ family protein [Verrucomicrobiota bacterium]